MSGMRVCIWTADVAETGVEADEETPPERLERVEEVSPRSSDGTAFRFILRSLTEMLRAGEAV